MNVLLRNIILSGGAPQSMLQYVRVLRSNKSNIKVIAQLSEPEIAKQYRLYSDEIVVKEDFQSLFYQKKVKELFFQLKEELNILRNDSPDLVLALGEINGYFYGAFCECLGIPIITFLAGGDLTWQSFRLKNLKCKDYICFSKENEDLLKKCRKDTDRIHVISNRIMINKEFNDLLEHYYAKRMDSVHILLTSRISDGKFDSIYFFLKNLEEVSSRVGFNIDVRIAGTGNREDDLRLKINEINKDNLNISLLGHVDDLTEQFGWTHLAVGKGRSVLEPIMMNRLGCVIGDKGELEIPDDCNLDRLYHYNFAGRHLVCDNSIDSLCDLVKTIFNGYNTEKILKISKKVRQLYSAEFLTEKFMEVIKNVEAPKSGKKVNILFLIFRFYYIHLKYKLLKK